jgi:hypothetical protein
MSAYGGNAEHNLASTIYIALNCQMSMSILVQLLCKYNAIEAFISPSIFRSSSFNQIHSFQIFAASDGTSLNPLVVKKQCRFMSPVDPIAGHLQVPPVNFDPCRLRVGLGAQWAQWTWPKRVTKNAGKVDHYTWSGLHIIDLQCSAASYLAYYLPAYLPASYLLCMQTVG